MAAPLIAIDMRRVRPGMTGVGRMTAHLVRELIGLEPEWRFGLLTGSPEPLRTWLNGETAGFDEERVELWPVTVAPESHPANEWWMARGLPRLLRERGASLFHGPAFQVPPRMEGIPSVLTVPDTAHLCVPETQPWLFRRWLDWAVSRGCRDADRIVTLSPAMAAAIARFHPEAADRVRVVPGGVGSEWRPRTWDESEKARRELALPPRFIIHVGTFEPRKNHRWLLEVHTALCAEISDPPDLVMVGAPGPTLKSVRRWVARSPWRGRLHLRHGVDDAALPAIVGTAEALVFPSLMEGFGLPVLEAMASGVPVVAADTPGLDTFRDSPALLCPLGDLRAWLDALVPLLHSEMDRADRAERGVRCAAEWTWARSAEALRDVFAETLNARGNQR